MIIIVFVFLVLGVFLLSGKGGFLIAGYNMMTKEEKEKYDEGKLCRFVGLMMVTMSFFLYLMTKEEYIFNYGIFGVLGSIFTLVVFSDVVGVKEKKKISKGKVFASIFFTTMILIVLYTGRVDVEIKEGKLYLDATMSKNLVVNIEDIKSIEFVDEYDIGTKNKGINNAKINAGVFKKANEQYYLYSYRNIKEMIIIKTNQQTVAFNSKDTKLLYENLKNIIK